MPNNSKLKGQVRTPSWIVQEMVSLAFNQCYKRILDPGCGSGEFIQGIIDWCSQHGLEIPQILGIEIDEQLIKQCISKFGNMPQIKLIHGDFLLEDPGQFDLIVGNPPYVSYQNIPPQKRKIYRKIFRVAHGRFDLYMLFFEKCLRSLAPGGRMVLITPEKYLYVHSARKLRQMLLNYHIEQIKLLPEKCFGNLLAYPAITVVNKTHPGITKIILRNGSSREVKLTSADAWFPEFLKDSPLETQHKLQEICIRISAGVATGRDEIFILPSTKLSQELSRYAWLSISGKQLSKFQPGQIDYSKIESRILIPYDSSGRLLSEQEAKPLIEYLSRHRHELEQRYAVRSGKPWYSFHEDPPMKHLVLPKILWRDIDNHPRFWADIQGKIIPRHCVYYLIPKNPSIIPKLLEYLNSDRVRNWLNIHCQRAANGFLRLQSSILKQLPIPESMVNPGLNQ